MFFFLNFPVLVNIEGRVLLTLECAHCAVLGVWKGTKVYSCFRSVWAVTAEAPKGLNEECQGSSNWLFDEHGHRACLLTQQQQQPRLGLVG